MLPRLGIEPLHKNVEGTRAKLKRLTNRKLVTESENGIFSLAPKGRNLHNFPLSRVEG